MIIFRNILKDGNLLPDIINTLEVLPKNMIYSNYYYLREPKIILNISCQRLYSAFNNTLNLEEKIRLELNKTCDVSSQKLAMLSSSIIELLESINSYTEDCLHIFKSTTPFCSRTESIKETFVHKWLHKAKHPTANSFYKSIKEYKDEISYYINEFKHQHGRIDIIVGEANNENTLAYTMKFIGDSPDGPQETLDLNEIKSIIPDLNYHFYQFYRISSLFKIELVKSIEFFHNKTLQPKKIEKNVPELENILIKLQYKNLLIFPNNEFFTPKVFIESGSEYLKISYPLGITKENINHIIISRISGKAYPNHQLVSVPSLKTIELIKNLKLGDELKLSMNGTDNFLKLFFYYENYKDLKNEYSYWEVNYDGLFKLKTFTNINIKVNFEPGMNTTVLVKKINVEYLGIKAKFGDLRTIEIRAHKNTGSP